MVPRSDIPRSTFVTTHSLKTTFNGGDLIPFHVDEVLPGDVHQGKVTLFARLATPLYPIMDYMELETFFFFVPMRLLWVNAKKFFGERANPADSISYTIPTVSATDAYFTVCSIYDYMGIPVTGQMTAGQELTINALPFRAYYLIWNDWFRDQNLQNSLTFSTADGPDVGPFAIQKRNKKHDYFTSALPWPIKGGTEVTIPMAGTAPITGLAVNNAATPSAGNPTPYDDTTGNTVTGWAGYYLTTAASTLAVKAAGTSAGSNIQVYADLASATGQTINALRLAFQTQRLLERDARSGTRYTELLRSHFGVTPEDQRLQRPEYIGGGRSPINTQAIPQTSATGLTGGASPLGALGAAATASDQHSFSYHATEHGYIIGLVNARAEITYQQGLHRMWTRSTRYDFYWPAFAHLGEQAIRNDEIYATGTDATDTATFGYQERWAEYRHRPSRITGLFRSTSAGNIDEWHLAEHFGTAPALNSSFLEDKSKATFERAISAGATANNMQVLLDALFKIKTTRAMPMFSVPGQIDRF